MQAIIDDQGRVEIPRALRERLHLTPGSLVDLEPAENGLTVTPVAPNDDAPRRTLKLTHEGSILVVSGMGPVSVDDVTCAIEAGRQDRLRRITSNDIELP